MWYQGPSGFLLPGIVKSVCGDKVTLQNEWNPMSEVSPCMNNKVCVHACMYRHF